jgi:integrase/recombinase XerC
VSDKRKYIKYATPEKLEQVNDKNKKLIDKYFKHKQSNLSDSSRNSYQSDFNQLLVYILENYNNEYILDIIEDDPNEMVDILEDFIAFCVSVLGNNERRIQRRMASISSFFIYLRRRHRDKVKENPLDYLDRPKIGKGEKPQIKQTFLDMKQVQKIRNKLKKMNDLQLLLFFEFGLSTMARANAIANVKISQIDFKTNRILDVLEKEGYLVTLFPSKECMKLIRDWLAFRKKEKIDNEYLFITKYRGEWGNVAKGTLQNSWIKKIGEIIGISDLHCHDLRHSGSNLLHKKGASLETISKLLNHKGVQVTQDHYILDDYDMIQDEKAKFEI